MHRKRFPWFTWLAAALVAAPAAMASGVYGKFLPPDQAFRLQAHPTANAIVLQWQIADGYYLYRDKFSIAATDVPIGPAQFPVGKIKHDPYFGRSEIYRHAVRVTVPYGKVPADRHIALKVTYQGCADAGLCYPPITRTLRVPLPPTGK